MLRHFPQPDTPGIHRIRDYFIATLTFVCVAMSLNLDASGSLEQQNNMGLIAWTFLFGLLLGENKEVRMQVIVAVAFATLGNISRPSTWAATLIDLEMCLRTFRPVTEWSI